MTDTKPYHHGELRPALINAASAIIRDSGIEGLSMRKLADKVGVSRTAPYHHFKDKNALLCAIAEIGFEEQDRIVSEILGEGDNANIKALFTRWVKAYINFANDNQQTYDLMYGKEIWKRGEPTASLQQVSKASFRLWVDLIEHMQQHQILPTENTSLRTAQASWAALHGLARLLIDGIYMEQKDLEEIADTVVALMTRTAAN